MTLYPYQETGAAFLAERPRAFLADEMGLGKTRQAIEAANRVGAVQVLVICPASVRSAWRREARAYFRGEVFTVESYDKVARDPETYSGPWCVLILDEAHYLKSPSARRTQAIYGSRHMRGVAANAVRVWALSGTPAPNDPTELYSHMAALFPDTLRMASDPARRYDRFSFTLRYCRTRDTPYGLKVVGGQRLDDLRDRMAPYLLRRLKREVLPDLPPIRYVPLVIDSQKAVAAIGEAPEAELALVRDAMKDGDAANLSRLTSHVSTLRRITARAKAEVALDWLYEWLDSNPGRKIVVFGQHVESLDMLHVRMQDAGGKDAKSVAYIKGGTYGFYREKAIDRFQNDPKCRVFIGQIQAAGTGITLTAASDMLFVEQSWTPAENAQAAMRIHRIGQKDGCLVRYLCLAGSIDEAVQRVLARKAKMLSDLFD